MLTARSCRRLAIAVAISMALLLAADRALINLMCGNTPIAETHSPDGSLDAVIFERNCGATTGFSTQVSIVRRNFPRWNTSGNVFVADSDHGRAPAGPAGGPHVTARWESADTLVVTHDTRARVFKAAPTWGHVRIVYELSNSSPTSLDLRKHSLSAYFPDTPEP